MTPNATDIPPNGAESKLGFRQTLSTLGRTFWMLNIMEMWERLAYYGMRVVVPIYIMQADEPMGLHFTPAQKGVIYFGWAIMQSWLPMFTGGYADRYGYKPTIFVSITVKIVGYVLMATQTSYTGFFAGCLVLAAGTAIFKPGIQGSLAQTMKRGTSSVGWSLFYQCVNIGAWLGPFLAHALKDVGWPYVFYGCAAIVSLNYLMLFTYREVPSGAEQTMGFRAVFKTTLENIWPFWFRGGAFVSWRVCIGWISVLAGFVVLIWADPDFAWGQKKAIGAALMVLGAVIGTWLRGGRFELQLRLPILIMILSGFWMVMYQIWDLHPNFIVDWIDSTSLAENLKVLPDIVRNLMIEDTDRGVQVSQEQLINLNALLIMIFVSLVGFAVRSLRVLTCMVFGIMTVTIGVVLAGFTTSAYIFLLGITFFSFGEMLTGPKKNEYFATIAPPGKKALYLGYVNIPIAIGQGFGALIAGSLYGEYGEKAVLAQKYIAEHTDLGAASDWNGEVSSLSKTLGIDRTESFAKLQEMVGIDAVEATTLLWNTYEPQVVWLPFAAVAVVSAVALAIFGQMAKRWSDMNA